MPRHRPRHESCACATDGGKKRLLLLEEAPEMTGSKSALEAMCTLTGGEEKLSGSTLEKAHPEIRTA